MNLEYSDHIDTCQTDTYRCRLYIRNPNNAGTTSQHQRRFWSELWDRSANGSPGKRHFVSQFKTPKYPLGFDNVTWVQETINLPEDSLAGSFDFSARLSIRDRLQRHVGDNIWQIMEAESAARGLCTSTILKVITRDW